jgi:hypothetical protein
MEIELKKTINELHQRQARAAATGGYRVNPIATAQIAALEGRLRSARFRKGDKVRWGWMLYRPEWVAAWDSRADRIWARISPGPYEVPGIINILVREAAVVEHALQGGLSSFPFQLDTSRSTERVVLGTLWRGNVNAFATNTAVRDYRIVLVYHGLPGLFYMVALAMTAAWSAAAAPAGRTAAFNPTEEHVRDRLSESSLAISTLAGTLTAYLYSGDPWRTPLSRVESERTMPLGVLLSLAERWVLAHEYAHVLFDLDDSTPKASQDPHGKELRADAVATNIVLASAADLDSVAPAIALAAITMALRSFRLIGEAFGIAKTGRPSEDLPSQTHPSVMQRLRNVYSIMSIDMERAGVPEQKRDEIMSLSDHVWRTIDLIGERVFPTILASHQSGRKVHPIWDED